jgi:two-component sensor histidine kinase
MSISQRTLLLIDDNAIDRNVAKRYLLRDRQYHHIFLEAETGEQGLEMCRRQPPDCILMDYNLPDMDGLEVLAELTGNGTCCRYPIVVMTGSGNESVAVQAMQGGAQDYLVKSKLTAEGLLRAINNAVEKLQLQRHVETQQQRLQQQNAELQLRQTEIETLNARLKRAMAESHHRIKNNLQVLAALVDLQMSDEHPGCSTDSLQRIGQSIRTMAVLHDLLTKEAKNNAEIDAVSVESALEEMLPLLKDMAGEHTILLEVATGDVSLSVKRVTPLVMLVNELVSNARKHGGKTIRVCADVTDGVVNLVVDDDGPGFPADFDPAHAANTGLDLILSLVRHDLNGDITFENRQTGGATVRVRFPL